MADLTLFSDLISSLLEMFGFIWLVRIAPLGIALCFLPERRKLGLVLLVAGIVLGLSLSILAFFISGQEGAS